MTQTTPAKCDSCGSPSNVPQVHYAPGDYLCPDCTARDGLCRAAESHLHALLWPAVVQWAHRWSAAGLTPEQLAYILSMEGEYWHPQHALARQGSTEAITAALNGEQE